MRLFRKPVRVRSSSDEITMTQHLGELRFRIIRSLLAVVIGALVILSFYDPVLRFLTEPYRDLCASRPDFNCDGTLYGLGPLDGISARIGPLKIIMGGAALAAFGFLAVLTAGYWSALVGFGLVGLGFSVIIPELFRLGPTNVGPSCRASARFDRSGP